MLEADSALAAVYRAGKIGDMDGATTVAICERRQRQLVQVSGWKRNFESVCDRLAKLLNCEIPLGCRRAVTSADRSIFRIGPERLWIIGPSSDEVLQQLDILSLGEEAVITEIEAQSYRIANYGATVRRPDQSGLARGPGSQYLPGKYICTKCHPSHSGTGSQSRHCRGTDFRYLRFPGIGGFILGVVDGSRGTTGV